MKKDKHLNNSDLNTWQDFINNTTNVFDKDKDEVKPYYKKRYKFDLHGYTLDEANIKTKALINFCIEKKIKEILLITGKGIHSNSDEDVFKSKDLSKLKFSIPDYIKSEENISKHISSIQVAPKEDGGEGALLIKLKKL